MLQEWANEDGFRHITVLVFISVLLLLEGAYLLWKSYRSSSAKKLSRRLQALAADSERPAKAQILKEKAAKDAGALQRWLATAPQTHRVQRLLLQADLRWNAVSLVLWSALLAAAAFLMGTVLSDNLLFVLAAACAVGLAPWALLLLKRRRRFNLIGKQLPDALDFIVRALRAGHALPSAILMCGEELPEPIAGEFRYVHDEITFGVSLEQALSNFGDRVPLMDVRYFIVSVLIQRESGGNLTEVLSNLSRLIRERYKLLSKIRILAADGRFSAWILAVMPFGLGAVMNYFNPEFMSLLWTDPIGHNILRTLAFLMFIGFLILQKIVKIRV